MLRLILANAYRNRRGYLGYLLAATLAVATFFSFGFFLFHPGLAAQSLPGYCQVKLSWQDCRGTRGC